MAQLVLMGRLVVRGVQNCSGVGRLSAIALPSISPFETLSHGEETFRSAPLSGINLTDQCVSKQAGPCSDLRRIRWRLAFDQVV